MNRWPVAPPARAVKTPPAARWLLGACCLPLVALVAACSIPHITPRAADDLRHREPAFTAAPPGHPFAVVEQGMATGDVRTVLGKPSSLRRYPTMWTFVPFYTGSEERRTVWSYSGQGRILFGDHPRSGELEVIRVEFDPDEDGV